MSESPLNPEFDVGPAFSWASIGLAVVTAILQGLVTATTFMTESSGQWTFRFRLALIEHYWWTFVSSLLFCSLGMSVTAFASGRGGDPVSVLALSSATFLAVIQYTVPAWQQRRYTLTRWYAWAGDSRTAINKDYIGLCRDAAFWSKLVHECAEELRRLQPTSSDYYGWRLWYVSGVRPDPTDVFRVVTSGMQAYDAENGQSLVGVYHPFDRSGASVSFLWGSRQEFVPRVSRAIMSMPLSLLRSMPITQDGYNGRGLTIAMGILGRNKGLQPWKLVFRSSPAIATMMETCSTWTPRPAKVLRSFYTNTLRAQYSGLGEDYVNAAVELALLLVDMPNHAIDQWLRLGLEHQSLELNQFLAEQALIELTPEEQDVILGLHYESSYASMVMSLNCMNPLVKLSHAQAPIHLGRPDLICTALLAHERGIDVSKWWRRRDVQVVKSKELQCLPLGDEWKLVTAMLLGLDAWPAFLDDMAEMKTQSNEKSGPV